MPGRHRKTSRAAPTRGEFFERLTLRVRDQQQQTDNETASQNFRDAGRGRNGGVLGHS